MSAPEPLAHRESRRPRDGGHRRSAGRTRGVQNARPSSPRRHAESQVAPQRPRPRARRTSFRRWVLGDERPARQARSNPGEVRPSLSRRRPPPGATAPTHRRDSAATPASPAARCAEEEARSKYDFAWLANRPPEPTSRTLEESRREGGATETARDAARATPPNRSRLRSR